jgi:Mor family transcriptional regulator
MAEVNRICYSYWICANGTKKRYTRNHTIYLKTGKPHGIPLDETKQLEFYQKVSEGNKIKDLCNEYHISYYFARQIIDKYK